METLSTILQTAAQCHQLGQLSKAEQLCQQACKLEANQPDALHLLAIIYAQSNRYPLANEYFKRAIASAPRRADFYGNFGNALWQQEHIDEAIMHCQRALELDKSRAETHNVLGSIYLSQSRLEEAATSFRNALMYRAKYPHALNNMGNALQKMKQFDAAITYYQQAISLQDNYPEAHNNLGQALRHLGRIDEARSCFRRAVDLRPDFKKAIQNCAEVDPVWLLALYGKNVHLQRYREEDANYLYDCYQNPVFMAQYNHYIPRHQHVDGLTKQLRHAYAQHPCQLKTVDWIIFNTKSGKPIGLANLAEIQFAHQRAELLVGLPDPMNHNKGFGLEATLLVLDYVFNRIGLNKLTSLVYADNVSAQKNALALGFIQESFLRDHIYDVATETFLDLYGNGMTARDFRENNRLSRLSRYLLGRDITSFTERG